MRLKNIYPFIFFAVLILNACGAAPTPDAGSDPQPNAQKPFPTPDGPSGTIIENNSASLLLSHPEFNWKLTLPADWIVTYDAGFQVNANNPDKTIFMRLQAQRWGQASDRLPNAQAYVDHWKNFSYGNVFPLFANGTQLSETTVGLDKFGGPYLQYEFDDSQKKIRYLQVYASAGGPASAMVTAWTVYSEYDKAQNIMQDIINSFELLENAQ